MAKVFLRREPVLHGESATLEQLRSLPDDWAVFYSLSFLDRKGFDRQRELDYLALHPTRGAIFIEVKGGRVAFESGRARQLLDTGWTPINPTEQLNNARRVAIEFMRTAYDGFIPGRNLYVFPSTDRPSDGLNQELSVASVFSGEMTQLANIIEDIADDQGQTIDIDALSRVLEPCLTHDVNIAIPEASWSGAANATLASLESGVHGGFASLAEMKAMISSHRAELQEIWDEVAISRTDLEELDGRDAAVDSDLLSTLLRETENLLASDHIEIGVFGQVKRGKSTLVNALVNREVSAVGMLPKTAVPVVIEWAPEESGWIQYADGSTSVVPLEAAIDATTQQDRKHRESAGLPRVERVTVRMPLDWLPAGVRLVDTPGLSDPSMVEDYERFAKAELERVAAGVLVISYPPGPEVHESELMRSLASFGLAKLFFVVNMWSDVWKDQSARAEVAGYVTELVSSAASAGADISPDDVRVFASNLGAARTSQSDGDDAGLAQSGLPELKAAVEDFLSSGALGRIAIAATRRLTQAADVIRTTLTTRREIIEAPERVEMMRAELSNSIKRSETLVDGIMEGVSRRCEQLKEELDLIACQPYDKARSVIASSSERTVLRDLQTRMSINSSTAASQIAAKMNKVSTDIVADARNSLARDLQITNWNFANSIDTDSLFIADFSEPMVSEELGPTDYSVEARGIGGVIGAMLGGGAGVALAATGPLGLLIGGLFGVLLGDTVGKLTAQEGNTRMASAAEISKLHSAINEAERGSRAGVAKSMKGFEDALRSALENQKKQLLSAAARELSTVEGLLANEAGKREALAQIDQALDRLEKLVG